MTESSIEVSTICPRVDRKPPEAACPNRSQSPLQLKNRAQQPMRRQAPVLSLSSCSKHHARPERILDLSSDVHDRFGDTLTTSHRSSETAGISHKQNVCFPHLCIEVVQDQVRERLGHRPDSCPVLDVVPRDHIGQSEVGRRSER